MSVEKSVMVNDKVVKFLNTYPFQVMKYGEDLYFSCYSVFYMNNKIESIKENPDGVSITLVREDASYCRMLTAIMYKIGVPITPHNFRFEILGSDKDIKGIRVNSPHNAYITIGIILDKYYEWTSLNIGKGLLDFLKIGQRQEETSYFEVIQRQSEEIDFLKASLDNANKELEELRKVKTLSNEELETIKTIIAKMQ